MKRPQGFVPPEPQPEPDAQATVPAEAAPRRPGRWSRPAKSASHDDTSTEPIAIVTGDDSVPPRAPVEIDRTASDETAAVESGEKPDARSDVYANERSAEKQVRKAERQRRRFERFEVRRFTQASRRRRLQWLGGIGGVLAFALLLTAAAFSPLMALRTIQVEGASRVPAEQLVAALEGQLGTPLPLIDFDRIKAELAPFTLVQSFSTETRPPSTLVVRVVERTPLGSVVVDGGFNLVDAAGVVIVASPERQPGYPVIEANGAKPEASFAAVTSVIRSLPAETRAQLDVVRAETADDVTLVLLGGQTVVWGAAEDSALKAVVLARLMAAVNPDDVTEFDVSSPNAPVYR